MQRVVLCGCFSNQDSPGPKMSPEDMTPGQWGNIHWDPVDADTPADMLARIFRLTRLFANQRHYVLEFFPWGIRLHCYEYGSEYMVDGVESWVRRGAFGVSGSQHKRMCPQWRKE